MSCGFTEADASLSGMTTSAIPSFDTPRLQLLPLDGSEQQAIFHLYSHPDVSRLFGQDCMTEPAQARYWLDVQAQMRQLNLGVTWLLRHKASGECIGTFSFDGINLQWHNVGISYALHPDFWHQGLMSEAMAPLLAWAWTGGLGVKMHRVQALVFPQNAASVATLSRAGFVREGQRLGLVFWQGQYWDLDSYCLLSPLAAAPTDTP
ncbi:GNAT family protein [Paludibacterium sp. THUN1379]|nr:GNAT family protein [Paludibacterium sp. THUN1379]